MAHNVALLLAALVCVGIWWGWTTYQDMKAARVSPPLPAAAEVEAFPQVEDQPTPVEPVGEGRQGRGSGPRLDTSPSGVRGTWYRPNRPEMDDDDE